MKIVLIYDDDITIPKRLVGNIVRDTVLHFQVNALRFWMIGFVMRKNQKVQDSQTFPDSLIAFWIGKHLRIIHELESIQPRCQDAYACAVATIDEIIALESLDDTIKSTEFHRLPQNKRIPTSHPDATKCGNFFCKCFRLAKILTKIKDFYVASERLQF